MTIEKPRTGHFLTLLIAACLLIAGCSIGSDGTQVATSPDGQCQVTLPKGWTEVPDLNEKAEIQVGNIVRLCFLIVLSEPKTDFEDPSLEWHSEVTRSALLDATSGTVLAGPKNLQINGHAALQYEIIDGDDSDRIVYLHTSVDTGEHLHQVLAYAFEETLDRDRPALESAVNSFRATSP